MNKFDVQIALEGVREARAKWAEANREFVSNVETVMARLLHEAAANYMSVNDVAKISGLNKHRVRTMMKMNNLDPTAGKTLLHDKAAKALSENAELLGVQPHEMDLTSPLAYLPMGNELRKFLETEAVQGVKELPEDDIELDFEAIAKACLSLIRGGALIKTDDTGPVEIRLRSLGGDPERWGLSKGDLELLLQAKS